MQSELRTSLCNMIKDHKGNAKKGVNRSIHDESMSKDRDSKGEMADEEDIFHLVPVVSSAFSVPYRQLKEEIYIGSYIFSHMYIYIYIYIHICTFIRIHL
jgi:hypothetical protein